MIKGGPCIGEGGVTVSYVNTDVKYLLRMSIFTVVSLRILLSCLSGAITHDPSSGF